MIPMPRRVAACFLLCFLFAGCGEMEPFGVEGSPATPDPKTAIALSVAASAVYLVDPDSGARQLLVENLIDFQAGYATWAPDHRRLAFGNSGIFVLDTSTGKRRVLVRGQSIAMPAWSSSGKQIAYGDSRHLWVTSSAKGQPIDLSVPQTIAPLSMAWRPGPAIAFAGLVMDCAYAEGCHSTDLSDIWMVHPTGDALTQVTHVSHAGSPRWSPDGSKLLFVRRFVGKRARSEAWVVSAAGGSPHRLVAAPDVIAADWSPDGSRLALVREGELDRTLELWVGNADGTGMAAVSTGVPGTDASIDW